MARLVHLVKEFEDEHNECEYEVQRYIHLNIPIFNHYYAILSRHMIAQIDDDLNNKGENNGTTTV